VSSKLIPYYI